MLVILEEAHNKIFKGKVRLTFETFDPAKTRAIMWVEANGSLLVQLPQSLVVCGRHSVKVVEKWKNLL